MKNFLLLVLHRSCFDLSKLIAPLLQSKCLALRATDSRFSPIDSRFSPIDSRFSARKTENQREKSRALAQPLFYFQKKFSCPLSEYGSIMSGQQKIANLF